MSRRYAGVLLAFAALLAIAALVYGWQQDWGTAQLGPVSAWIFGAVTLVAVLIALNQAGHARDEAARAEHRARIDRELLSRRECLRLLAESSAAITSQTVRLNVTLNALEEANPDVNERNSEPNLSAMKQVMELAEEWVRQGETPVFNAKLVISDPEVLEKLHASYDGVRKVIEAVSECATDLYNGKRPEVDLVRTMYAPIPGDRQRLLDLGRAKYPLDYAAVAEATKVTG